jgi:hypothetical protein
MTLVKSTLDGAERSAFLQKLTGFAWVFTPSRDLEEPRAFIIFKNFKNVIVFDKSDALKKKGDVTKTELLEKMIIRTFELMSRSCINERSL